MITQCLRIGIGNNKLHPFNRLADHVFNGVTTATTDANDLDHCVRIKVIYYFEYFRHIDSPLSCLLYYPKCHIQNIVFAKIRL